MKFDAQCMRDQIFSYTDYRDGKTTHYNVGELARMMERRSVTPTFRKLGITRELYEHVLTRNGVERGRVNTLTLEQLALPIYLLHTDDGFDIVIDGSHRIVRIFEAGLDTLFGYQFTEEQVKPCIVEDFPESLEQLLRVMQAAGVEHSPS